ncbi:nephrocystin-3 [Folsomia candida]|uniref:Nephrocystin-3 n=1 Tax=Folsomia candida TaxID=158441 RepID=A0A226D444_FOLCA|nr:nephrocystin-3 [Folsomia candida]OXA39840.1 Nephrocystin-3 [Folsomia candida]
METLATFGLSIVHVKRFSNEDDIPITILSFLYYIYPQQVSVEMERNIFQQLLPNVSYSKIEEFFKLLHYFNLITTKNENRGDFISIATEAYFLLNLPNGEHFLDETLHIFQSMMPITTESWVPIIATLIENAMPYHSLVEKYVDLTFECNYLMRHTYKNFKKYLLKNLGAFKRCFGPQHEHTLNMRNWYISAINNEGKFHLALKEWKRLEKICDKKFPQNHWLNIDIKQRIALVFHELGMFQEAKSGFETLLEIEFGKDNEITKFRIKGNYALTLKELNEYDPALSLFNEVLAYWSNLGDDIEICSAKHNIAAIYFDQERFSEAKDIFQELLEISTKMFGEEDAETLETKIWMAKTCWQIYPQNKKLAEAIADVYKHVHAVQIRALGEHHPRSLETLKDLAVFLFENGVYNTISEVKEMLEVVLQGNLENFGDKHPKTLGTKFLLAQISEEEGDMVQALQGYKEVLAGFEIIYGGLHPSTISAKEGVGLVLYEMKDFEAAKIIFEEVYQTRITVLGRDDKKTLFSQYSCADCLNICGEWDKASKILEEILEFDGQIEEDEEITNLFQDTRQMLEKSRT